ncbi:hypothetical protein KIN20_012093 [Parelaphostrongylus tenuis]|uniref:Uncharacterized protein n=1 Tax=Parelaphostrongylus tenuis TaxID=148309 RepID=A0AAD5QQA9_PARTN|nr:hypothetical protein KIN20_012093 [Parelaphostrongylus tenuis]
MATSFGTSSRISGTMMKAMAWKLERKSDAAITGIVQYVRDGSFDLAARVCVPPIHKMCKLVVEYLEG